MKINVPIHTTSPTYKAIEDGLAKYKEEYRFYYEGVKCRVTGARVQRPGVINFEMEAVR